MPFQTPLDAGSPLLNGHINAVVHEHDGTNPVTIIRTDSDWSVHVRWGLHGLLAPMICGAWDLHVMLESIGPGTDYSLIDPGDHIIPLVPGGPHYTRHFDVNAGTVAAAEGGTPYKMVVSLTYRNPDGTPGPIAAYHEGPILQFFNP